MPAKQLELFNARLIWTFKHKYPQIDDIELQVHSQKGLLGILTVEILIWQ